MNSLVDPARHRSPLRGLGRRGADRPRSSAASAACGPGLPGVSENIRVISIVDKFLEHSRITYFQNDDKPEVFLSSADWMPRNFRRRVEIMFPIEDPSLQNRIVDGILGVVLSDNVKARELAARRLLPPDQAQARRAGHPLAGRIPEHGPGTRRVQPDGAGPAAICLDVLLASQNQPVPARNRPGAFRRRRLIMRVLTLVGLLAVFARECWRVE